MINIQTSFYFIKYLHPVPMSLTIYPFLYFTSFTYVSTFCLLKVMELYAQWPEKTIYLLQVQKICFVLLGNYK